MNKFLTERVAKYRFLIFFIFIYFLLAWLILYREGFIGEELVPFLPFSPKIVNNIDKTGSNVYSVYFKGLSPEKFSGRINYIGSIKTATCHSNHVSYLWELPNGYRLPIMKNAGSGSLFYYIHRLFFRDEYRFDLIKIHIILIGALILLIMWIFLKDFLNIEVANVSLILLSTSRLFSELIRGLWFSDNYSLLSIFLIIFLLWKYIRSNKLKYLYWCAFTIGIALYIKLTVLWFLAALFVLFIYYRPHFNLRFRHIVNCALFLMLGSLPLIIYNIDSGGESFIAIKNASLGHALFNYWHYMVLAIIKNIVYFLRLLLKDFPEQFIFLAISLFIYLLVKPRWNMTDPFNRRTRFLWSFSFLILLFIVCSAYEGNESYYMNLCVLFVMAEAATLVSISRREKDKNKKAICALVVVFVIFNIFSQGRKLFWFNYFKKPTGEELLVEYLNEGNRDQVTFEYILVGTIEFLSKGKIRPLHYYPMLYGIENENKKRKIIKKIILNNLQKFFIIHCEKASEEHVRNIFYKDFVEISQSESLSLCLKKLFYEKLYEKLGRCGYIIMKVADNDCAGLLGTQPAEFMEKFK